MEKILDFIVKLRISPVLNIRKLQELLARYSFNMNNRQTREAIIESIKNEMNIVVHDATLSFEADQGAMSFIVRKGNIEQLICIQQTGKISEWTYELD